MLQRSDLVQRIPMCTMRMAACRAEAILTTLDVLQAM